MAGEKLKAFFKLPLGGSWELIATIIHDEYKPKVS